MDLRGFTDMGRDIGRRVTDSINTGNFEQLNRDIKRTIEDAFTNPVNNNKYRDGIDGKLYREEEPVNTGFDRVYNAPVSQNNGRMPGKGAAIAMMITGYAIAGLFGLATLGLGIMIIPAGEIDGTVMVATAASTAVMAAFTGAGIILGVAGTKKYSFAKRFRQYLEELRGNSFCQIKQLSEKVKKNAKFVIKDLTKMIEKGYFPEGHIDDHKTCFMLDDATYRQYTAARDSAAAASAQPEEQPADENVDRVIREGQEYIRTIQKANDAIYDPVISEKLFRMEIIVKKIFEYVKNNPDQIGQLKRFMSYYMPTTEKLVKAYQQMDEETVLGKNMTKAKDEIAQTLDTINEAYEKLYDSMHIDIAMDVSSDIAVLKTMFAQEGLSKDELGGK